MVGISLEEAILCLEAHIKAKETEEWITLDKAYGRILAQDIEAPFSLPPFDRSPLDGYAFCASSSKGASKETPVYLKVQGEVCAGDYFKQEIKPGEAVRIMTGAPIPKGCDCVLRQEDTDYGENMVAIYKELKAYANYCFTGEDIKKGSIVLAKGEKLNAITMGVLASLGFEKVKVKACLKMALLCSGDELMPLGKPLEIGKIYNSNGIMLKARAEELGIEVIDLKHHEDTAEEVARAISKIIEDVDLVVTTGGVSVGKKDIMHEVIPILGAKRLFWRVAMQPGTPVLASCYRDKLIIGLSGNPFAALANFELLVRPVLAKLIGDNHLLPTRQTACLESDFLKESKKRRFIRAKYENGKVYLNHSNHASGALYTMSLCNCLIDIPAGTKSLHEGETVEVVLL